MKYGMKLAWLLVFVGALTTMGCMGQNASKTFGTVSRATGGVGSAPAVLEAVKVCDDYQAGEATADGTYKGKAVSLKGSIKNVRDDRVSGKKYLELKGSEGGVGTRNVRCYFTDEFQEQIAKLKPGEEVKVQGTCKGKQGTADNFDVTVENCKLLK